jgi:hypothetical protein
VSIFRRFPSRGDLWAAFLVCLVPVQTWSWYVFIFKLPSYLLSLPAGQTLGIFAYLQVYALIEAAVLWLLLALLSGLLPAKLYRDRFTPQTVLIAAALSIWAIGVHWQILALANEEVGELQWLGMWTLLWLAALTGMSLLAWRKPRLAGGLRAVAERFSLLAGLYLLVDIVALGALMVRNLVMALA